MSGLRDTRICLHSDDRLVLVSLDCDHVSMAFLFYFDVYWISPPPLSFLFVAFCLDGSRGRWLSSMSVVSLHHVLLFWPPPVMHSTQRVFPASSYSLFGTTRIERDTLTPFCLITLNLKNKNKTAEILNLISLVLIRLHLSILLIGKENKIRTTPTLPNGYFPNVIIQQELMMDLTLRCI